MPTITKKKTKMIVKDGNGDYLQLLPETELDAELDEESGNPVASSAVAEVLSGIEDAASNMGAIKVMDEEPTALNTTEYTGETLIAWVQPESWSITINTDPTGNSNTKKGEIPFSLYGINDASLIVDWGDGSVEEYTAANSNQHSCINHEYENAGEYTIEMNSNNFDKLYLWENIYEGVDIPLTYMRTLISINSPLPKLAGIHYNENGDDNGTFDIDNTLRGCFNDCNFLQSVPERLFSNNNAITDISRCFNGCTSLRIIPSELFLDCTATNFGGCFNGCRSLQSVPERLFSSNNAITSLSGCFVFCTSLADFTLHISSSSVTDCSSFVTKKTGTTRTIYVPSGSTTQTSFNNVASSLGLTIIGE